MNQSLPSLSAAELRVLGTLAEKQRTVPDTYPLSLNALVAGCNQKTSRHPVMELSEADAAVAIETLKEMGLVSEVGGGRVVRFAHQLEKVLQVPTQASALLTVLMLRGPQTAGELRLNCERLHSFADISSVEAFLEQLAARNDGALVRELPKAPGARENRWTHLLGDAPLSDGAGEAAGRGTTDATELDNLKARISILEGEVAELKVLVSALTKIQE